VIGLQKGILRLVPERSGHGYGIYWSCVQSSEMFLGFQNVVSGTFIECISNRFIVEAKLHRESGYFCIRAHPDGGYIILAKHGFGFLPMQIDRSGIQLDVGTNRYEGRVWEFIRVEHKNGI
jgi:hypothetical protein